MICSVVYRFRAIPSSPPQSLEIAGFAQSNRYRFRGAGQKKKYAGMMPSEMKRLRELEDENNRLKRIVADLSLDKEMLQDIVRRKI